MFILLFDLQDKNKKETLSKEFDPLPWKYSTMWIVSKVFVSYLIYIYITLLLYLFGNQLWF